MALEPGGGGQLHADIRFVLHHRIMRVWVSECDPAVSERTNLLLLKRLLDLLQVGEQADVCTDLQQTDRSKMSVNKLIQRSNANLKFENADFPKHH